MKVSPIFDWNRSQHTDNLCSSNHSQNTYNSNIYHGKNIDNNADENNINNNNNKNHAVSAGHQNRRLKSVVKNWVKSMNYAHQQIYHNIPGWHETTAKEHSLL